MVIRGQKNVKVSSIREAVARGLPLRIKTGEYWFSLMEERFPMLMIKPATTNIGAVSDMRAGRCAGVILPNFLAEVDVRSLAFNPDCKLEIVGRPIVKVQGSFAARTDVTND